MSKDYNKLLQELKKHNDKATVSLYVPSTNTYMDFKPLSVKQQTAIITGVMTAQQETNAYAYQNILDDIILKNCETGKTGEILAIDRASILVQLRLLTMGEHVEIDGVEYDLKKHVDEFTQIVSDVATQEQTLEYEGITVSCSPPSLQHEFDINTQVPQVFKNTTGKESVSDIFLIELTKYVDRVDFSSNQIDFEELTLRQKVQICEMLPMVLSQKIVEYIEQIREYETPHVQMTYGQNTVELPIDSQLFN